jgi:hypothetical protein
MYTADMRGRLAPAVEDTLVRTSRVVTREIRVAINFRGDNVPIEVSLTRVEAGLHDTVLSNGHGEGSTDGDWAVRHLWRRNARSSGDVFDSHERI